MSLSKTIVFVVSVVCGIVILTLVGTALSELHTDSNCTYPVEKICYRYESSGGIFGGSNSFETSCNNPHDYYINKSTRGDLNCTIIYQKGFD